MTYYGDNVFISSCWSRLDPLVHLVFSDGYVLCAADVPKKQSTASNSYGEACLCKKL